MGSESPAPAKEYSRAGVPKKGLTPHFSFGGSPEKREEEKENGRGGGGQAQPTTKRYIPVRVTRLMLESTFQSNPRRRSGGRTREVGL